MKKNSSLKKILPLIIFAIASCTQIDKKSISVIEGIELGQTYKLFNKQLDSLGLKPTTFYTKLIFTDINDLDGNVITYYTTDVFNLSQFRKNGTSHYGLLYPITMTGTDNVIGLNVIIGNTFEPSLVTENGSYDLTKRFNRKTFNQNIPFDLFLNIKSLLTSKYGEPKTRYLRKNVSFYVVQGNLINKYPASSDYPSEKTIWETEFLKIELIEGLFSNTATFSSEGYKYTINPPDKPYELPKIDAGSGERICNSYVHINYELKPEIIKKLKLDETKL